MRPKSIYVGVGISACKVLDLEVAMFMKNSDCVYIPLQIIAPNCIHSEYMGGFQTGSNEEQGIALDSSTKRCIGQSDSRNLKGVST